MIRRNFWIGGSLAACLLLVLYLIPGSTAGTKSGREAQRTSLLGQLVGSVGESFTAPLNLENLPGYNDAHYQALPEKEKAAYRDYLVRLDKDVRFLKTEMRDDKPRFDAILQTLYPEQLQSLHRRPDTIESAQLNTPEGHDFANKQALERKAGGEVMKIDLMQEILIRYGPRLSREEKKKIENEITRIAGSLGH